MARPSPDGAACGCVFDLDGVLVDSGEAHKAAWQRMAVDLGYTYPEAMHRQTFGMRNPDIIRIAWGVTEPAERVAAWGDRKEAIFREQARALQPLPGAVDLVHDFAAHGWRLAIGSSAPRANVTVILDVLGLAPYFATIVSSEDIARGKPDPQVFRTGLERLGVPPAAGVVVEDAVPGVQAGVAAGAFTVGITTTRSRADLLAAGAHLVVDRLAELDAARLEALLRARAAGAPPPAGG